MIFEKWPQQPIQGDADGPFRARAIPARDGVGGVVPTKVEWEGWYYWAARRGRGPRGGALLRAEKLLRGRGRTQARAFGEGMEGVLAHYWSTTGAPLLGWRHAGGEAGAGRKPGRPPPGERTLTGG